MSVNLKIKITRIGLKKNIKIKALKIKIWRENPSLK